MTITIVAPLALWAVYLLISFLYHLFRRRQYALIIETAGAQYTALTGPDVTEIDRIMGEIVSAIEDRRTVNEYCKSAATSCSATRSTEASTSKPAPVTE